METERVTTADVGASSTSEMAQSPDIADRKKKSKRSFNIQCRYKLL
jgi:hypothetical protein